MHLSSTFFTSALMHGAFLAVVWTAAASVEPRQELDQARMVTLAPDPRVAVLVPPPVESAWTPPRQDVLPDESIADAAPEEPTPVEESPAQERVERAPNRPTPQRTQPAPAAPAPRIVAETAPAAPEVPPASPAEPVEVAAMPEGVPGVTPELLPAESEEALRVAVASAMPQARSVAPPSPRQDVQAAVDAVDWDALLSAYGDRLHSHIQARLQYPRIAQRAGLQGTVLLEVSIDARGRVLSVEVRRSSGHRVLDRDAVESVRSLGALPAPPREVAWGERTVSVPVTYRL